MYPAVRKGGISALQSLRRPRRQALAFLPKAHFTSQAITMSNDATEPASKKQKKEEYTLYYVSSSFNRDGHRRVLMSEKVARSSWAWRACSTRLRVRWCPIRRVQRSKQAPDSHHGLGDGWGNTSFRTTMLEVTYRNILISNTGYLEPHSSQARACRKQGRRRP